MSNLTELIKALLPSFKSQTDLDNAYLCESINVFDLERRMRAIDATRFDHARSSFCTHTES
jgi:hypothetical protein